MSTGPDPAGGAGAIHRVLVVDDDPDLRQMVRYSLEAEGLEVVAAGSADEALDLISRHGLPHLAVVDIMMPGTDGLELSRRILRFCDLPIIMLTAVEEEETVVAAIDQVAEDYVTKPFNPKELAARVRRVLRRMGDFAYALGPETRVDDRLAVDFARQELSIEGQPRSLTPTESKILHVLMRSTGRTVTSDFLLRRVWPLEEVYEDTLRVHIHRLRQKIEPDPAQPRYLITHRGVGYSFLPR